MTGMLRVPRSRGLFSGLLLILLGAWGALIPFIGPYFHYAYTPGGAWTFTAGRFWMEILPGVAVVLGGVILLVSTIRPVAMSGAALAAVGGAWFTVGPVLRPLWPALSTLAPSSPVGSTSMRVAEEIGFFYGLGVVIVFFAALALGRLMVVGTRDVALATEPAPGPTELAAAGPAEPAPAEPAPAGEDGRVIESRRNRTYAS